MSKPREPIRELLRDPTSAERLDAIWQRIEVERRPRGLRRTLVPALVASAALALLIVAARAVHRPAPALPSARDSAPIAARPALRWQGGGALSAANAIEVAGGSAARAFALSDGTRIRLAAGTRLVPQTSSQDAVELALERGEAYFEVAPQGARRFEVAAGALRVRVVGTAFTVERAADVTRIAVAHGRVRVFTPAGERLLSAGGALRWPPEPAPPAAKPARPAQLEPVPQLAGQAAWRAAVASGDYQRAYVLVSARGYARTVREETQVDALLDLADVARGAGHPRDAALALARIVQRYPHDDRSALAALTLGRLQLDALAQPAVAARSLRRALELGLPAALQEDALARLVQASAQAGNAAQARATSDEYRLRFPGTLSRTRRSMVESAMKAAMGLARTCAGACVGLVALARVASAQAAESPAVPRARAPPSASQRATTRMRSGGHCRSSSSRSACKRSAWAQPSLCPTRPARTRLRAWQSSAPSARTSSHCV